MTTSELHGDAVVLDAEALLIQAGDEPGAGRRALRRGDVAAREPHAVARELVEVRRADVLVHALHAEIGPAVVVGEDEEDVGRTGSAPSVAWV